MTDVKRVCEDSSHLVCEKFDLDEIVDVREKEGRIIIEPVRQKTYELNALLKGITPKNQHQAADFGPALGEEVW